MDAETGVIITPSNGALERGIYEVAGKRYVFCKSKSQYYFMVGRPDPDIHTAWRMGYREELSRYKNAVMVEV